MWVGVVCMGVECISVGVYVWEYVWDVWVWVEGVMFTGVECMVEGMCVWKWLSVWDVGVSQCVGSGVDVGVCMVWYVSVCGCGWYRHG